MIRLTKTIETDNVASIAALAERHAPNDGPMPPGSSLDISRLETHVAEVKERLSKAKADCRKIESGAADIGRQMAELSDEPSMSDFSSPMAWRQAVDAQQFERHVLATKFGDAEERQRIAAGSVMELQAQLNAALVKQALAQAGAALAANRSSGFYSTALQEFRRAYDAYYGLPSRYREDDGDFAEQVSRQPCQPVGASGAGGSDVSPAPALTTAPRL